MSVIVSSAGPVMMSMPRRLLLFVAAVAVGSIWGYTWNREFANWSASVLLSVFADPNIQIASLGTAMFVGFALGLVHIVSPCYLPAAFGALPLAQVARDSRQWLKTVAVLTVSMVAVTALFGVIVGAPTRLLAGTIGSPQTMGALTQITLIITGIVMLVVALGELGLTWRLLPSGHTAPVLANALRDDTSFVTRYRQVAFTGVWIAATFGIVCPKPLYLAVLVYVAVVGSMAYGALALGAYGLGLAAAIALCGFVLLPASRGARLSAWLAAHAEGFHIIQGVVFAVLGALTVSFWWLRYTLPTD
jgi:cytochrome c biogenesis protein CcdA